MRKPLIMLCAVVVSFGGLGSLQSAQAVPDYLNNSTASISVPATGLPSTTTKYATANLNIWDAATGNSYRGEIRKGAAVAVTGATSSGRAQVVVNGQVKWVTARYLRNGTPAAAPASSNLKTTTKYATATLNIWAASTGKSYSGEIKKGAAVNVTGASASGRAQIVVNGQVKWVTAKYLRNGAAASAAPAKPSVAPKTTTKYATAPLNIWAASTGKSYSGEIRKGSAVAVTGTVSSGRAQIVHNGATKWVTAQYLANAAAPKPAPGKATPAANMTVHVWTAGGQAQINQCKGAVDFNGMAKPWISEHDYCGGKRFHSLKAGQIVKLTGAISGTYRVIANNTYTNGKENWSHLNSGDAMIQTCVTKNTTMFAALQRI